eukprot:806255-Amphidinium_carterae.2
MVHVALTPIYELRVATHKSNVNVEGDVQDGHWCRALWVRQLGNRATVLVSCGFGKTELSIGQQPSNFWGLSRAVAVVRATTAAWLVLCDGTARRFYDSEVTAGRGAIASAG